MAAVSGLARTGQTLISRSSHCARHRGGAAVWRRMCGLDRRGRRGLRRVPPGRRLVHAVAGPQGPRRSRHGDPQRSRPEPGPPAPVPSAAQAAPSASCRPGPPRRLASGPRSGLPTGGSRPPAAPLGRHALPGGTASCRSATCECEPASRCQQGTCDFSGTAVGPGFGTANRDASRHGRAPADAPHFPPLRAPSLDGPARRPTSAGPPAQRSIRQRIRAAAALDDALGRPAVGHPSERSKAQLPAFAPNPRVRPLRSDRRRTISPHAGAPRSGPNGIKWRW